LVAGVEIEAVRTGVGVGPTKVLAAVGDRFAFTRSRVGFPMLSQATIPDDMLAVAYIVSATPGNRWCEIDLEPGAVLLYGPEVEHTARNLQGLDFMFAITGRNQLEEHAKQIGCPIAPPSRGCVHLLANPPRNALVQRIFPEFAKLAASGEYPSNTCCDDVLRAMTHAASEEEDVVRVIGNANRIDGRSVVHACIDYANAIGRIPSISELCLVTHVSERRLRTAFTDEFDTPPSRYFRAWAVQPAQGRLLHHDDVAQTVTEVAAALGFDHLGRFAGQYREIYRETPSTTLQH
jgi:AraC-like DNA-binding protein